MRQGEVVELEIPGAPEYVAIARQAAEGIARRMSFPASQVEDLKLAVGEACTNAVKHGCPHNGRSSVVIRYVVQADGLMVEIRNHIAEGCSPQAPGSPDFNKEGGLGLYLMHQLVDEVDLSWDDETATVRLTKLIR